MIKGLKQKTSITDYEGLRETQRQLSSRDSVAEMRKRRALSKIKNRRKPLSRPQGERNIPRYSKGPFLVGAYNRSHDRFQATSIVQSDEVFLGKPINNGALGTGDIVRGWHNWGDPYGFLEQTPRGKQFIPAHISNHVIEEYTYDLTINIGYSGK